MSDWERSLIQGEADARAILRQRKRKVRDVPLYGFAWAVLDYAERVRESVKRNDTEGALNALLQAISYHAQMMVIKGAENYRGLPMGMDQVIRDANIGTSRRKEQRAKRRKSMESTAAFIKSRDAEIRRKADEMKKTGTHERKIITELLKYATEHGKAWPTTRAPYYGILNPAKI